MSFYFQSINTINICLFLIFQIENKINKSTINPCIRIVFLFIGEIILKTVIEENMKILNEINAKWIRLDVPTTLFYIHIHTTSGIRIMIEVKER